MACTTLAEFVQVHGAQIKATGFPASLISDLYNELSSDVKYSEKLKQTFSIKKITNSRPSLVAKKALAKESCFFILDHVWTNDGDYKSAIQLKKSPDLAEKISSMFNTSQQQNTDDFFCFDTQVDAVEQATNCSSERAKKALENYDGCIIEATQAAMDYPDGDELANLSNNQATVNDISFEEFKEGLKANGDMPDDGNEQFLLKMYNNFCRQRAGCGTTRSYNWEDEGDVVTVYVPIPNSAHKNAIKSKLTRTRWSLMVDGKDVLDGELHSGVKVDDSFWSIESPGVLCMTLEKISGDTWTDLLKGEEKLSSKAIVQIGWAKKNCKNIYYNDILDTMWKYNQTYSLALQDNQGRMPQWYIMDEIGSALTHSDYPNFKCSPFFYSVLGRAYSLIWPIEDVETGILCTRNFIPQIHSQETPDMSKARLKAYTDEKVMDISKKEEKVEAVDKSVKVLVKEIPKTVFETPAQHTKIHISDFSGSIGADTANKLHVTVSKEPAQDIAVSIVSLKETKISVAGEVLPSEEVFANKDYFQSYLLFRFGRPSWFLFNFILPEDLLDFNADFEKCNTVEYWLVKPVDRRVTQFQPVVSSQYARIARLCETGSIAVSRYVDQLRWRQRTVTLSYPVLMNLSTKDVYIHKCPVFRISKDVFKTNDFINEYDNSTTISESQPSGKLIEQAPDTMEEFKVQMNKLLLPKNPDKGWAYLEQCIFEIIGKLGKGLAVDTSSESSTNTFVVFNTEVIIGSYLTPQIVDIVSSGILPSKTCLLDLLKIGLGSERSTFVKV